MNDSGTSGSNCAEPVPTKDDELKKQLAAHKAERDAIELAARARMPADQ